jgi:hypothetical protein
MFVVDCVGKSGGLALLWSDETNVEVQNYSRRHINAKVKTAGGRAEWKFMGFYGHPEASKRCEAWGLLRHLSQYTPLSWVCVGDFNEILDLTEKFGGGGRPRGQMEAFKQTLEDCYLYDLGYRGPRFTWNNNR